MIMFISLSHALSKFGRLHFGIRLTSKNFLWMSFIMLFVAVFQMTWYMMVLCFWLVYAVCYGLICLIKAPFKKRG